MLALAAGYARRAVVDSDQFANRATAALRGPERPRADRRPVTDESCWRRSPTCSPRGRSSSRWPPGVVGGGAFAGLFRAAVRDVHRAVFDRDQDTVTLTLRDVGTVLAGALAGGAPGAGRRAPARRRRSACSSATSAPSSGDLVRCGRPHPAARRGCCSPWPWRAPPGRWRCRRDRRATTVALGRRVAAAGRRARGRLRARPLRWRSARSRARRSATPRRRCGTRSSATCAPRLVLAGVAAPSSRPRRRRCSGRSTSRRRCAAPRARSRRRARRGRRCASLRGAALIAAGLVAPARAATPCCARRSTLAGVLPVYAAVTSELLRLIYRPRPAAPERPEHAPRRRRPLIAAAVGAVLVGGARRGVRRLGRRRRPPRPPAGPCNGHAELCDRPLDEVALPATHNSMSVAAAGLVLGRCRSARSPTSSTTAIRGLLIDTHYADRLPNGRLRTVLRQRGRAAAQRAEQDGVSPEARRRRAAAARAGLGFRGEGERGMYLCHTFCELGATPLATCSSDIHDFLVANPGEVVVVVNQDYVTPAGLRRRRRATPGSSRYAFTPPPTGAVADAAAR